MMKYFLIILLFTPFYLFPQTNQKSILYLESKSKKLIENSILLSDSNYSKYIFKRNHSVGNTIAQGLIGSVIGLSSSLLTGAVILGASFNSRNVILPVVSFYTLVPATLIFGSAIGVHLIAKQENPKHSFWQTAKYSSYGAGGGVILSLIIESQKVNVKTGIVVIVALTPLIGSLIYSNFIAEWPENNPNNSINEFSNNKLSYSFKDYYESTQSFRINVLSIAL